jgi:hypothetical protein
MVGPFKGYMEGVVFPKISKKLTVCEQKSKQSPPFMVMSCHVTLVGSA